MILGANTLACQEGFELNVHHLHHMFNFAWRKGKDHPHLKAQKDFNMFPLKSSFLKEKWKERFFLIMHKDGFELVSAHNDISCQMRESGKMVATMQEDLRAEKAKVEQLEGVFAPF
ncbi:hypothetical protein JCGZ_27168 [Jatropha curcas]|uniref:Uncharacterized protein n=1 Tax=Jatropha curcas TaxID=180498 RepID=A0A067JV34_JATCU|nr:hypothetical protein JCGZ_27168 [Jatropha curcas]